MTVAASGSRASLRARRAPERWRTSGRPRRSGSGRRSGRRTRLGPAAADAGGVHPERARGPRRLRQGPPRFPPLPAPGRRHGHGRRGRRLLRHRELDRPVQHVRLGARGARRELPPRLPVQGDQDVGARQARAARLARHRRGDRDAPPDGGLRARLLRSPVSLLHVGAFVGIFGCGRRPHREPARRDARAGPDGRGVSSPPDRARSARAGGAPRPVRVAARLLPERARALGQERLRADPHGGRAAEGPGALPRLRRGDRRRRHARGGARALRRRARAAQAARPNDLP